MKIEITMPQLYKNYMIVGVAIEAPRLKGWKLKGIVYSKSGKELKQLELNQATFSDKITAQSGALRMCRYWIDSHPCKSEQLIKRQRKAALAKLKARLDPIAGAHANNASWQGETTAVWGQF